VTDVELRQYIESLIKAEHALTNERFASVDRALEKADAALSHRLNAMNDLQHRMEEAEKKFTSQNEHNMLEKRTHQLEMQRSEVIGKSATWTVVLLILAAVVGLAAKYLP
jgi:predicted nuclease with TOPRIM domain